MRFAGLAPRMWRLPECIRKTFPPLEILKRLAAPRCVLTFSLTLFFLPTGPFLRSFLRSGRGTRFLFRDSRSLFRRKQRQQDICFHARAVFHQREIRHFFQQAFHLRAAHFLMRHFAAAMENHGLHFVSFAEEALDLILAHLKIVLGGGGPEFYFLELRSFVMLLLLVLFFAFLIKIFAVVGDLADRRIGCRRNFHDVQPALTGKLHGLERLHDAQLRALFIYHANFPRPDAFIHPDTVIRPETSLGDKPTSSRTSENLP